MGFVTSGASVQSTVQSPMEPARPSATTPPEPLLKSDRIGRAGTVNPHGHASFLPSKTPKRASEIVDFTQAYTIADTPGPHQAAYAKRALVLARATPQADLRRDRVFNAHLLGARVTTGKEQVEHTESVLRLAEAPDDDVTRKLHRRFEAHLQAAAAESMPMSERVEHGQKALGYIQNEHQAFEGYLRYSRLDIGSAEQREAAQRALAAATNRYQRAEGSLRVAELTEGTPQVTAVSKAIDYAEEPAPDDTATAHVWQDRQRVKVYALAGRMQAEGVEIPGRKDDFARLARSGAEQIGSAELLNETNPSAL